jgi:hypothetical protein
MAYSFISNKKNGTFTIHVTSTSTLIIAGNNSVSNVAVSDEEITGAHIKKIAWGSDGTGSISLSRGANVVAILNNTGDIDYTSSGGSLNMDEAANLVVTFVGANNYCIVECSKLGSGSSEYLVG